MYRLLTCTCLLVSYSNALYSYDFNGYCVINGDITVDSPVNEREYDNCGAITSVTFTGGVTSIGKQAFEYAGDMTTVTFLQPSSLTTIGEKAFKRTGLTSFDFSGMTSLTTIGKEAFDSTELTSISLAGLAGLTTIETKAFWENRDLASVDLSGTGLTTIEHGLFEKTALTSVNLAGMTSLTTIKANAFRTELGTSSFSVDLTGLTSLTTIEIGAFDDGVCFINPPIQTDKACPSPPAPPPPPVVVD